MNKPPTLEMLGVSKKFGATYALRDVTITAHAGEVHALMGENGAGKSTLMKILAGVYQADAGAIRIDGREIRVHSPLEARHAGINLIYQELSIAPNLSVAQNIFMGSEPSGPGGLVNARAMRDGAARLLASLGASFAPEMPAARLSIAEQQLIEIARALVHDSKVLIMDEPTAALSDRETERLFDTIRTLRSQGIAIIYISHRMDEVYALADRVSVLRDGEYIGTLQRDEVNADRVVQMMVGRSLSEFYTREHSAQAGDVVLDVRNIERKGKVAPSSLQLRAGEVVGLAGLVGAGRTELARLIFGADARTGGEIYLNGQKIDIRNPVDAVRAGIGYVPEDRKSQGLFLQLSAHENLSMNVLRKHSRAGLLNGRALSQLAQQGIEKLSVRLHSPHALTSGLSGGNQQKVLLGRWLAIQPKVLLLDEPTRGVDVGAKSEIYRLIGELSRSGVAILVISSELPEIIGISDRVLVMREGVIAGELAGADVTQERVMRLATGVQEVKA